MQVEFKGDFMPTNLYSKLASADPTQYRQGCMAIVTTPAVALCGVIGEAVASGQHALADSISYQALDAHPDDPTLLSVCAKVSAMQHRWLEAADRLIRQVRILGKGSPLDAFLLLSRCQRCAGNFDQAKYALKVGMMVHPNSHELVAMLAELTELGLGAESHEDDTVSESVASNKTEELA